MFSYIASLLRFEGQRNSANLTQEKPYISCEGYGVEYNKRTTPDRAVRLRVSSTNDNVVRIFGYPPQEDYPESMQYPPPTYGPDETLESMQDPSSTRGTDGTYIHYLLGDSPASVKYIMGDDWRSRLISDHPPQARAMLRSGDVVLRPTASGVHNGSYHSAPDDDVATQAEERAHSLRMRRCGAVAICAEQDMSVRSSPQYLFGWPSGGGVWVSRPPSESWLEERSAGNRRTAYEILDEKIRYIGESNIFCGLAEKVKQQEYMEEVCRVLEEAGAQFYATIADCPEAVLLNLC